MVNNYIYIHQISNICLVEVLSIKMFIYQMKKVLSVSLFYNKKIKIILRKLKIIKLLIMVPNYY
jgi:hypothetical protein